MKLYKKYHSSITIRIDKLILGEYKGPLTAIFGLLYYSLGRGLLREQWQRQKQNLYIQILRSQAYVFVAPSKYVQPMYLIELLLSNNLRVRL